MGLKTSFCITSFNGPLKNRACLCLWNENENEIGHNHKRVLISKESIQGFSLAQSQPDEERSQRKQTPLTNVGMGRLHSKGFVFLFLPRVCLNTGPLTFCFFFVLCSKGISASALPYKRSPPSWLKTTSQDVRFNHLILVSVLHFIH